MKVLHITNNYPTNNHPIFGIFVKEQIESLEKLGISNEVFFINTREHGRKEYLFSLFKLVRFLYKDNYDLIHCHHSYSAIIFLLTGFAFKYKFIISYQSHPKIEGGGKLFNFFLKLGSHIILKNKIDQFFINKNVHYLPNGVDTEFFKPMSRKESKEYLNLDVKKDYLLFLDSYNKRPYKRIDRFDEVINILHTKYDLVNVESLKLTNTERRLMPFYFNASVIHLLTSDIEGSPNSVKESLSCNIPVVSTDVGNVKEMISDIDGCYVSNSFDATELADLVIKSLDSTNFNGRNKIIEKNYNIDQVATKLKSIYNAIIAH